MTDGISIHRMDETTFGYADIVRLLHLSFEERVEQGLLFTCSTITTEEYEKKMKPGVVLVAVGAGDDEKEKLWGTIAYRILGDKKGTRFGYLEYLAIHPDAKRRGLGQRLFMDSLRRLAEEGVDYVVSTTAAGALSSIRCHLKTGFRKIGLLSYPKTNYYSILFRQYLYRNGMTRRERARSSVMNSKPVCSLQFLGSSLWTRLTRTKDGKGTALVRMAKKAGAVLHR